VNIRNILFAGNRVSTNNMGTNLNRMIRQFMEQFDKIISCKIQAAAQDFGISR
jgi:hypothetical protein